MVDKYIVADAFHIRVYPDGEKKPGKDVQFAKGRVITADDIPEGWTADVWVAQGLIVEAAEA